MALDTRQREIAQQLFSQGYTPDEVFEHLGSQMSGGTSEVTQRESVKANAVSEQSKPAFSSLIKGSQAVTNFLGLGDATKTFGDAIARTDMGASLTGTDINANREFIEAPTGKQIGGALAQTAAVGAGVALAPISLPAQIAAGAALGYTYDVGGDLMAQSSTKDTLTPGIGTAIGAIAPPAIRGAIGALKVPAQAIARKVASATENIKMPSMPKVGDFNVPPVVSQTLSGIKQNATELGQRVPRFVGRKIDEAQEAGVRAERIKTSSPAVKKAIESELPEPLIGPVVNANPITKQAFKEVLDIADTPKTKLGQKTNPAIVGGDRASQQYDVIEAQRKRIGEAMNVETAKLGRIENINMTGAYSQLDSVLKSIGVVKDITEKGFKLNFSKSKLTQKQRTVVVDLYEKATEGGNALSPLQIREKDQLFSAIQRESRSDAVQDVIFTTADGQKTDLFRAFRDVYSNELDVLSPEIKKLNSQYRNVATLLEDIENSIFKTPDFNATKSTDPSEFAKVNLRRIFGEAQSSPVYEAIADEMDAISRQLGYEGASPKEVAAFAEEIRALYPEKTPKAGFQGGIRAGLSDIASSIMEAGKADTTDQRKALRALLEATS